MDAFAATLSSAQAAHAQGRIEAWAQWFLRGPGDGIALADGLRSRDYIYLLAEIDLSVVQPACGPEPEFDYPVTPESYEAKVAAMGKLLGGGWNMPPLIVHLPSLYLADGTHRLEALLRLGFARYWAIFWMAPPAPVGRGQIWGIDG